MILLKLEPTMIGISDLTKIYSDKTVIKLHVQRLSVPFSWNQEMVELDLKNVPFNFRRTLSLKIVLFNIK